MANTKEIKSRMKSVQDTQKITSAMYLIASTKMRRAKAELDDTRPYFEALKGEIKRVFRSVHNVQSRYFYPGEGEVQLHGPTACLVITADKGLAGMYNQNVIKKAEQQLAWNAPLMQLCMYAAVLLLSWFGARTIVACGGDAATGLSTGELLSLLSYATQILMSLMGLSMIFVMLTMSRTSGERVVELLNETPDITTPENAVKSVPDGSIDFEHVQFSYRHGTEGKPVLSDINLHIPAGATVGVIGGTGSSKSSFVQLIPRLYDVDLGAVKVGGIDVRKYDLDTLRGDVAMVLQKNVLFSGTIKDNLRWGDENATDEEIRHACQLAQADDFIQTFPKGYDTYIEQGGTNVSGGQKQRLCIARALLKKPKILILDDSTSAVDTRTDALIRGAFAKEIPNTTKIIIAQRIASVQGADMILVLDDGKIVSCGTHDELMQTSPIYREVYESQTKGDPDNATAS